MSETTAGGKRFRACEACHVLKSRCEIGIAGADSCERCWRMGQSCVPATRRRQKDRIAELESLVNELRVSLKRQNYATQSRLFAIQEDVDSKTRGTTKYLPCLDARVSKDLQQKVLETYVNTTVPLLPVVPVTGLTLAQLRSESPILLLSLVAFATSGVVQAETQDQLVEKLMQIFGMELIGTGTRSLEYVQALLVGSFWFRARPGLKHATFYQLFQLARGISVDLGLGGPDLQSIPGGYDSSLLDPTSSTGRRTWLACFIATSATSLCMRQSDSNVWTSYHEECLQHLKSSPSCSRDDKALCQIVTALKLCQHIALQIGLFDPSYFWDVGDIPSWQIMSKLHIEIEEWCAQIATELLVPSILFWKQIAIIHLYEPVLHNKYNKKTFRIPFPAAKIATTDFAAPVISAQHVTALYVLKDACQTALDFYIAMDPKSILASSPMFVTPLMRYTLFVLAKLYVSVIAPGNTYGQILSKSELRLEYYIEKMRVLGESLMAIDPTSFNSRILSAGSAFEDWFSGYSAFVAQSEKTRVATIVTEAQTLDELDSGLYKDIYADLVLDKTWPSSEEIWTS